MPAVDFLRAYDQMKAGAVPSIPVRELRGKTVLVGIVAEGRSAFVETPFTPQFPSIGMHATFIDNVLLAPGGDPNLSNIVYKVFDVLEEHSAITRGPVGQGIPV